LNIVAESIPGYQSKRIKRSRSDYPGRAYKVGRTGSVIINNPKIINA